jgi:hypothetical protein
MPLSQQDFQTAADTLGCDVKAIKAVAAVESSRSGFDPEGFPITLFEGHQFYRLTNGKYAIDHPTLCYPHWTREFYGSTWQAEKARLQQAMALDRQAALQSASWGMFQIMGFNYGKCGFKSVQEFVNAMCLSEGSQLQAFVGFVKNSGLAPSLQSKQWATFANSYNGPGYAQNQYDTKLAKAYAQA